MIWLIIILIIIIVLLLFNLFDIEYFDEQTNNKQTTTIENEKVVDKIVSKPLSELDNTKISPGTGEVKSEKSDLILDVNINNNNSESNIDYNETTTEENKSELGNDITIRPINQQPTIESTPKETVNYTKTTYNDKVIQEKDTSRIDALCASREREKEDNEINKELADRYVNQDKEYEQAFKCKNEQDYTGQVITDENIYQFDDFTYINANQLYIPTDYKTTEEDYGRNYIPPELWYKNNRRLNLPVCVPANGRCTVKETLTSGYPLDVIEWHESRKITNPDGINLNYVKDKLNTNSDIA